MSDWIKTTVRGHTFPLKPIATGLEPSLPRTFPLRAVLFDIYGTLLVSGVGDIGVTETPAAAAAEEALASLGCDAAESGQSIAETLRAEIVARHRQAVESGVDYPEVEIDRVWEEVLRRLARDGTLPVSAAELDARRLSLEYEVRVNSVWPMPAMANTLHTLHEAGLVLGIVSNAQWFTRPTVETLAGESFPELGFADDLQIYSYRYGRAKPSPLLFKMAHERLAAYGISPTEVLYLGNDMLNDCWGANQCGFRTALFAGDQRSLRLREGDRLVGDMKPDWIVTDLSQLVAAVLDVAAPRN